MENCLITAFMSSARLLARRLSRNSCSLFAASAGLLGVCALFEGTMVFAQSGAPSASQSPQFPLAQVTALPQALQMHGSAVVGKRLYVFGGETTGGWSNEVLSAEIDPRGGLGPWKPEEPMPERRAYLGGAVEVVNDRIYVCCGALADNASTPHGVLKNQRNVIWTTVRPDGSLAPWKISLPFPDKGVSNLAACSTDNHLYLLGGYTVPDVKDTVLRAEFGPDGEPRNWTKAGTLPVPMWFGAAAILDKRMYVWGGLSSGKNSSTVSAVVSAEVLPDGSLGSWRSETPMPVPMYASAFCGFNDYLICVGGRVTGGTPVTAMQFARLENGRVGPWQSVTTNLGSHVYHTLGLDRSRGWIFVSGGHRKDARGSTDPKLDYLVGSVQAFQIGDGQSDATAQPSSRKADAESLKASARAGKSALVYFRSPQVPAAKRFESAVYNSPEFKQLAAAYDVSEFDTSRDTSLSYQYQVFRVPSLVVIAPDGKVRRSGVLNSIADVKAFLAER